MARMSAAVAGGMKEIDVDRRKEEFNETKREIASEVDKLIDKIGVVNVVALLHALNGAEIEDIEVDVSKTSDFKANGWFSLDACSYAAIRVDEKLNWQERWVEVGKIDFGLK